MTIFKRGSLGDKDIHSWLQELRAQSHIPESGYAVACVLRVSAAGEQDYYFGGVNVENADHRLGTHAEEGALAAMVTALGPRACISEVWVLGGPKDQKTGDAYASCCGKCRQQIAGRAMPETKVHYFSLNGTAKSTTVKDFLPDTFVLPLACAVPPAGPTENFERRISRSGPLAEGDINAWLRDLQPVDKVSGLSQSVVLKLASGVYVAGTRIEDDAFLDVSAVQSAVSVACVLSRAVEVQEAWVYTRNREGQGQPATLPLSSQQVLREFTQGRDIPVHYAK